MGVDRALHVELDQKQYEKLEPFHVAKILRSVLNSPFLNTQTSFLFQQDR